MSKLWIIYIILKLRDYRNINKIMKLQFTKKEFEVLEQHLLNVGFKRYNRSINSEDFYYYKTLHTTEPDDDNETRSDLKLIFQVYDFSKYPQCTDESFLHLSVLVNVSRNIDERIELTIMNDSINGIMDYEDIAIKFYEFICETIKI
jgi:hypothetical protein